MSPASIKEPVWLLSCPGACFPALERAVLPWSALSCPGAASARGRQVQEHVELVRVCLQDSQDYSGFVVGRNDDLRVMHRHVKGAPAPRAQPEPPPTRPLVRNRTPACPWRNCHTS